MFAKVLSSIVVRNTLFFNLPHPKGKSINSTIPSKFADTISDHVRWNSSGKGES